MTNNYFLGSLGRALLTGILLLGGSLLASAQAATGSIHGTVADPSGAVVPSASITVTGQNGSSNSAVSGGNGAYVINGLAPGAYTISVSAEGFAPFKPVRVAVIAGKGTLQNLAVQLPVATQEVTVNDQNLSVDTSADNNASSVVIKGKDLDALSDDPDELQSELSALAGGSAGPNGGEIYVDGFSGGQLPPKSSIREIRVNQNPFSAQYDKLGYGRIEILTKPGTDKLHGSFMMMGNDSAFNSRNPTLKADTPPYYTTFFMGNAGGSLTKTSSWFTSVFDRNNHSISLINATRIDSAGQSYDYSKAVSSPQSRLDFSPRIDLQLGSKNTLTARYSFGRSTMTNGGISTYTLESQAFDSTSTNNGLQISDTQVINDHLVNETRFQYSSSRSNQTPKSTNPTESVPDAFTDGGSYAGASRSNLNNFELQNTTILSKGSHAINFGTRLRFTRNSSYSTSGFNGMFNYQDLDAYNARTPNQYTVTAGTPSAAVNYFDVGVFYQDDFKLRPNFTLSYGIRYESQNAIGDRADIAPRLSFAWAPGARGGKQAKTVIRGGYGWFFDRFGQGNILQTIRQNGVNQKQYVVKNPDFYPGGTGIHAIPTADDLASLPSTAPTIYTIAPNFKAAVNMQAAMGVEHQFGKVATLSATFMNSRGVHQPYSDNINAFIPSTYDPVTGTGTRPNGINENIYQYQSGGIYNQNQLTVNYSVRAKRLTLFGFYMLNFANADTSGANYFPSNQTNPRADYGRADFDTRTRFLLGGNLMAPFGISFSPMMDVSSGSPYNVTIGQDLNGDSQFNDRPAWATSASSNILDKTTFNTNPSADQARIPYNVGTGPGQFSMNLRVSKSIGIGPRVTGALGGPGGGFGGGPGGPGGPPPGGGPGGGAPGGGLGPGGLSGRAGGPPGMDQQAPRRYSLNFAANARNVFNNVNYASPVSSLGSPKFGQYNALAGGFFSSAASNRSIDLQVSFNF